MPFRLTLLALALALGPLATAQPVIPVLEPITFSLDDLESPMGLANPADGASSIEALRHSLAGTPFTASGQAGVEATSASGLQPLEPYTRLVTRQGPRFGYQTLRATHVKQLLRQRTGQALEGWLPGAHSALCGSTQFVAFGDSDSKACYLVALDLDLSRASMRNNPLVAFEPLMAEVTGLAALSGDRVLCTLANKDQILYQVPSAGAEPGQAQRMVPLKVRRQAVVGAWQDLALHPSARDFMALLDHDQVISLWDLEADRDSPVRQAKPAAHTLRLMRSAHNNGNLLTASTTDGCLAIYDIRTDLTQPDQLLATGKVHLFCHAVLGDHQVMLGYSDTELATVDLRRNGPAVASQFEPAVSAIYNLEASADGSRLLVSGAGDFSSYRRVADRLELQTHAGPQAAERLTGTPRADDYTVVAMPLGDEEIVASDIHGMLQLITE